MTESHESKMQAAETAGLLVRLDWAAIDELFATAGLEWRAEVAEDGKFVYLTKQLEGRAKSELTALDELLADLAPGPPEGASWVPDAIRLFVSHSTAEREVAGHLRRSLRPFNVDAFVAHDSIKFDEEWQDVIMSHLRSCHALLALVSHDFASSEWCDQEVGWVLGRELPVMSIDAGRVPYGFIGPRQALPFRGDYADVTRKIAVRLLALPSTARLATSALVSALELAPSYDTASGIIAMLESAKAWDSRLVGRLERAPKHNDQVRNADWGRAVERVQTIAARARRLSG